MAYSGLIAFFCVLLLGANAQELLEAVVGSATAVTNEVANNLTNNFEKVKFTLMTNDKNSSYDIEEPIDILKDPSFDASLATVLYMHGYDETIDSASVGTMSRAFLQRGSHSFIFVDWSEYARPPYITVFLALPAISEKVGNAVDRIVQAGLSRDSLWLIGHSMGGQMAGIVTRSLDFKPKRITALDPALPGYNVPGFPNLTRDDAVLVDVVHTDAGVFGFNKDCGHIDIWVNGGHALQPGCPIVPLPSIEDAVYCSHRRSWAYFAESVNDKEAFPAVRCNSEADFEVGSCPSNGTNIVYLGFSAPDTHQEGNFYLTTNAQSPYARRQSGIVPQRFFESESKNSGLEISQSVNSQTQKSASALSADSTLPGSIEVPATQANKSSLGIAEGITNLMEEIITKTRNLFMNVISIVR